MFRLMIISHFNILILNLIHFSFLFYNLYNYLKMSMSIIKLYKTTLHAKQFFFSNNILKTYLFLHHSAIIKLIES